MSDLQDMVVELKRFFLLTETTGEIILTTFALI